MHALHATVPAVPPVPPVPLWAGGAEVPPVLQAVSTTAPRRKVAMGFFMQQA
ncbi:hypothetical protein HD597_010957 [Nonomuraea thailandensis]|uniref:Uncharacterized protein n=1 Tax=Nonomuraea thailandensis TaxID=1188745 RepID=A0A9X2K7R6_9ACTN|nr:hypothetical protein [Nonomuraea thailandensis]MCP2363937.1 hypothetical protein [Nonomuraea thailandensis]